MLTRATFALLQDCPVWMTRWGSWWLTVENLLLLSFIQEPPAVQYSPYERDGHQGEPSPASIAQLLGGYTVRGEAVEGADASVPTLLFYLLFCLFLITSVILLINLLIAMMSSRYQSMYD